MKIENDVLKELLIKDGFNLFLSDVHTWGAGTLVISVPKSEAERLNLETGDELIVCVKKRFEEEKDE